MTTVLAQNIASQAILWRPNDLARCREPIQPRSFGGNRYDPVGGECIGGLQLSEGFDAPDGALLRPQHSLFRSDNADHGEALAASWIMTTPTLKQALWRPAMRLNYHLSSRSRRVKLDLFWVLMAPKPGCTVLNLGAGPPHLSRVLLGEKGSELIEQPEQDPRWGSLRVIGADLNPEGLQEYSRLYKDKGISAVILNGCRLPFRDKSIDIVFSNAVIEHLRPGDQELMANEIMRVARRWFVATPNFWYPIELHNKLPLLHFLPRRVRHTIQEKLGTYPVLEPLNLLTANDLARLLPGSVIHKVRVTFYPETLIAYKSTS